MHGGHVNLEKSVSFGQLASVATARLLAQFCAGTRKVLWDCWPPLLEQPTKLVLICLCTMQKQVLADHTYIESEYQLIR